MVKPMQVEAPTRKKEKRITVRLSNDVFARLDQAAGYRGRAAIVQRGLELALAEIEGWPE